MLLKKNFREIFYELKPKQTNFRHPFWCLQLTTVVSPSDETIERSIKG